jgi:hypothetical protein
LEVFAVVAMDVALDAASGVALAFTRKALPTAVFEARVIGPGRLGIHDQCTEKNCQPASRLATEN